MQIPNNGNDLLLWAIYGLGALTLFNLIATVAVPFFTGKDEDGGDDASADAAESSSEKRMMRMMTVGQNVMEGIQKFAEKYNNQ